MDAGISEIASVESDIADDRARHEQVLALAVQDARERAGFLANELGASLGDVHQIGRQRTYSDFTVLEEVIVTSRERSDQNVTTLQYEFQPGPVEVRANVSVEFTLK